MHADIANAASNASELRVDAPACLLLTMLLNIGGEPILSVFHFYKSQCAEFATKHTLTSLTHHGVSRIVVSYEYQFLHLLGEAQ